MAKQEAPISVTVANAHVEAIPTTYRVSGTVRGHNTATLTSKTSGYVKAVKVRSGDSCTRGQVLIELEANEGRAGVARASAALEQAIASASEAEKSVEGAEIAMRLAKTNHERVSLLYHEKAVSQQEFDDGDARYRSASAQSQMALARRRASDSNVAVARAALAEAQAMLDYAQIVAPFTGRVADRRVDPGTLASPGTALLVVEDDGPARVEAAIEESHLELKVGDAAEVELESLPAPVTGKVVEVVPSVDALSRAFLTKVELPADLGVRSGTFARVSFHMGNVPHLVVPEGSVTTMGAVERVFVNENSVARLRMITRGERFGPWTQVLSGLSAGEAVVVAPTADLHDGSVLRVQP